MIKNTVNNSNKVVALLVLLLGLTLAPTPLQAHSSPVSSVPAINEVLTEDPTVLRVTFGVALDPEGDHSVELLSKEGQLLAVGDTTQVDGFTLQAPVTGALPAAGTYIVRYLAYELEEGTENFTLSGYQFYFEPPEDSGGPWVWLGIGGGVAVVALLGGWQLAKRRSATT